MRALAAGFMRRFIAGLARAITGVSADWRGCRPEPRQRIYYANHTSHGDFLLIWTVMPAHMRARMRPVAAADYWDEPSLKGFVGREVFRAVTITREGPGAMRAAMEKMGAALNEGASLLIFPEGTRNVSETPLLPFQVGIFCLAKTFPALDLTPVWIDNVSRVMPKGEFLPIPLICRVIFGAPIRLAPGENPKVFLERAREALLALKPQDLVA